MLEQKRETAKYIKGILVGLIYVLGTTLFYRQAIGYEGKYVSDLAAHISFGVSNTTYSLLITIIGAILRYTGNAVFVALFESTLVVLTFLLAEKCIRDYFKIEEIWAVAISAGLLFLTSVYLPVPGFYFYKTSLIAQPWHNITYTGMRLLCLPVFFKTLEIIDRYQDHFTWKEWLDLAVPLLVCTMVKPNFLIDYSLTLLIVLLADFLGNLSNKTLNKDKFMHYIYVGTVVFPAIFILMQQGKTIYVDQNSVSEPSGIALVFLKSSFFESGRKAAVYKVVRDTLFPAIFALLSWKRFSKRDIFVYLFFGVTLTQVVLLTETGPRAADGNFGWGILCAGYLLYLYLVPALIRYIQEAPLKNRTLMQKCFVAACNGLLFWHLISGLIYFGMLMTGQFYYI